MRVVLVLALLPGCVLWSKRLDRYEIVVDSVDAVSVGVEGVHGAVTPLPQGGGEQHQEVTISGHTLALSRSPRDGVRIACETCVGPMILIGANGRLQSLFEPDQVEIAWGRPIVAYRPYYLVRETTRGQNVDWMHSTDWYQQTSRGVRVTLQTDWEHVQAVTAFQKPKRGLGWGLVALSSFAAAPGLIMLGERDTLPIGAVVLGGATVLGWTGWLTALGHSRRVTWFQRGDAQPRIREIDD